VTYLNRRESRFSRGNDPTERERERERELDHPQRSTSRPFAESPGRGTRPIIRSRSNLAIPRGGLKRERERERERESGSRGREGGRGGFPRERPRLLPFAARTFSLPVPFVGPFVGPRAVGFSVIYLAPFRGIVARPQGVDRPLLLLLLLLLLPATPDSRTLFYSRGFSFQQRRASERASVLTFGLLSGIFCTAVQNSGEK